MPYLVAARIIGAAAPSAGMARQTHLTIDVLVDGYFASLATVNGVATLVGTLPAELALVLDATRLRYSDATGGAYMFNYSLSPVPTPFSPSAPLAVLSGVLSGSAAAYAGALQPSPLDVLSVLPTAPALRSSLPLFYSDMALLTRPVVVGPPFFFFLAPFAAPTWGIVAAAFALAAAVAWVMERVSPYGFVRAGRTPAARHVLGAVTAVYGSCLALLNRNPAPTRSWSSRMVWVGVFFLALFLNQAYLSKLTAIVTLTQQLPTIGSWAEVSGSGGAAFAVVEASRSFYYITTANDLARDGAGPAGVCSLGVCDLVSAGMLQNAQPAASWNTALAALRSGAVDALVTEKDFALVALSGANCVNDVVIATTGLQTFFLTATVNASVLPGANFAALLDESILAAASDGKIAALIGAQWSGTSCGNLYAPNLQTSRALGTSAIIGVVVVFFIFIALAWITCAAEACLFRRRHRGGAWTWANNGLGWYGDIHHRKQAIKLAAAVAAASAAAVEAAAATPAAAATTSDSGGSGASAALIAAAATSPLPTLLSTDLASVATYTSRAVEARSERRLTAKSSTWLGKGGFEEAPPSGSYDASGYISEDGDDDEDTVEDFGGGDFDESEAARVARDGEDATDDEDTGGGGGGGGGGDGSGSVSGGGGSGGGGGGGTAAVPLAGGPAAQVAPATEAPTKPPTGTADALLPATSIAVSGTTIN